MCIICYIQVTSIVTTSLVSIVYYKVTLPYVRILQLTRVQAFGPHLSLLLYDVVVYFCYGCIFCRSNGHFIRVRLVSISML